MSDSINRRTLITAAGAGVVAGSMGVAHAGSATRVAQAAPTMQNGIAPNDLIVRKIPKGDDALPAIGLGTFMTFDLLPGARRGHLLEVTRRFWAAGGRVFDTSPLYGMALEDHLAIEVLGRRHLTRKLGGRAVMFAAIPPPKRRCMSAVPAEASLDKSAALLA